MEPGAARLNTVGCVALAGMLALAVACGDTTAEDAAPATTKPPVAAGCADVVEVEVTSVGNGEYDFTVTVRSPDTGWDKYADEWRVVAGDGTVLATRDLTHPHVDEQPFTRSVAGVQVPQEVDEITVEARDSVAGWCGETVTRPFP